MVSAVTRTVNVPSSVTSREKHKTPSPHSHLPLKWKGNWKRKSFFFNWSCFPTVLSLSISIHPEFGVDSWYVIWYRAIIQNDHTLKVQKRDICPINFVAKRFVTRIQSWTFLEFGVGSKLNLLRPLVDKLLTVTKKTTYTAFTKEEENIIHNHYRYDELTWM